MKCPKCGGDIPFYDLRPNCKHCGVNIYYYSQDDILAHDAKQTELEAAVARMVIARIKATFIGGGLQIARLVFTLIAATSLLLPFGGVTFHLPFYEGGFSAGLIGLIQGFQNGMLMKLPQFLGSTLLAKQTLAAAVATAALLAVALLDIVLFVVYLLSFLNLQKGLKIMRTLSLIGMVISLASQIAALVFGFVTPSSPLAKVELGFGGFASFAMFLVLFLLNNTLKKRKIEPVYREYDPRRKELLKKVRAGEVNLDDLPLPIFESEEEHEERMKALQHALEEKEG